MRLTAINIFLSHASEDHYLAERIATTLRRRGLNVFLDRDDLPKGSSFDERIERAVRKSDFLLFLISPASVARGSYTLVELKMFSKVHPDSSGRILGVVVNKTAPDELPAYLRSTTILDPTGEIVSEVAFEVGSLISNLRIKSRRMYTTIGIIAILITASIMGFLPLARAFIALYGSSH